MDTLCTCGTNCGRTPQQAFSTMRGGSFSKLCIFVALTATILCRLRAEGSKLDQGLRRLPSSSTVSRSSTLRSL